MKSGSQSSAPLEARAGGEPDDPPPSWVFLGKRHKAGAVVVVREPDGIERDLPARLDLRNHSPTGFEWGYGGSGPAQLALAILAYQTGDDELALRLYQRFKEDVVARFDRAEWELGSWQVRDWLALWPEGGAA